MFENLSQNFDFVQLRNLSDYLMLIFLVFALIQLFYYLFFFIRLTFYKNKNEGASSDPVSVIVCAKNERDNLLEFLPSILNQDYPEFEVVVVNDHSVDDTAEVLKAFEIQYSNLKVVNVPDNDRFYGSKKLALTLGIKGAKHDHLLLTDADCKPLSNNWIKEMSSYNRNKQIILGYGGYKRTKGLLNALIRFETFFTAIQYLSFAIAKVPYMGVGRNLAYHNGLFFANKGFSSHQHILSGDDDLFINEVAKGKNTQVVIGKEASTVSIPKTTFKEWITQKKRHLTTGKYYKLSHKLLLGGYPFSLLLFLGLFIYLMITVQPSLLILSIFVFRLILQFVIFGVVANKLDEKGLWYFTPIFELFFLVFQPLLLISNFLIKNTRWR